MAEAKTLDYYLANPEEMPENLAELAASMEQKSEPQDVEAGAPSDAEPKEESPKEEEAKPVEEAPKLLSKDGKNEIPYQVLVSERERRAQAEKQAEELRKQIAEIEAKVAAVGKQEPEQQPEPEHDVLEDVEALANDFPEVGKVMKALQMQVQAANKKLQQVEEQEQQRRIEEASRVRNTVQEAIDSVPALSYWQSEDPEMFAKAIEFDNILKADSRNSSLSMKQRFEKVVTAMEAIYGSTNVPGAKTDEPPQKDMNELTEKAKEVVKETGSFKPRTLSDIPGGTPPASSESDKLSAMSPAQLAAMMQGMDGDQINSLLAKLG
jgi:hypothetical protein